LRKLNIVHLAHNSPIQPIAQGWAAEKSRQPMPDRPSFRTYVSYRLELVARAAVDAAEEVYQRECGLGIRPLRVLRTLVEAPDITVSEIVEATMFERSLVSRLIGELVRAGLITRRICDVDARQIRLSATPDGERIVAQAYVIGDALNNDLLSVLSPDERACFESALDKLTTWRPGRDIGALGKDAPRLQEEEPR
jgi:DNA-binding MarR family transcriptional regulator